MKKPSSFLHFIGVFLLLSLPFGALAQQLSGRIADATGTSVSGASVHLLNTDFGAATNREGRYEIKGIPAGRYTVRVSAVGFAGLTKMIAFSGDQTLDISLTEVASQLDEVVVTADKTEQLSQRLPQAISTLSARQVEEYRLWNLKDLTAIVPNLNAANPGDDRNNLSLRGIASASYDQPVATYVDGVSQFRLDAYIPQLLDIERIEVLRGPQGTLYGRNAMGGVINVITRQPGNETRGFAELNFGSYGQQRYSLGVRTPLVKDKLFFGASGMFDRRDGYYTNVFNNSKFDRYQAATGNYYLKWLVSPRWSATVNLKHHNRRNDGSFALIQSAEQAFKEPFKVNYDAIATDTDNTLNASLTLAHYGPKVDFTSISAWQQNLRYYQGAIDADVQLPFEASGLDVNSIKIDQGPDNRVGIFTQELRLNSSTKTESKWRWTLGSFFFFQNDPTRQSLVAGTDAEAFGQPGAPYQVDTRSKAENFGIAFFGQVSYALAERLDLTAGLRYDYETQNLSVGSDFVLPGVGTIPTQADTSRKTNFSAVTPKLALAYRLSEQKTLYLSYSRGFRSGGLSQIDYDPSAAPLVAFDPEYSDNVEIGLKTTTFENRLRANVTLFATTVSNAQITTLLPTRAQTAIQNAGNLQSRGLEVELSATPLRGLQVEYNFGYTDAKYTKLALPVTNFETGQTTEQNFNGNRQILTPDVTSMLAIQYGLPVGKTFRLLARGEWRHLGTQFFDLQNNVKQDPYDLFNVRAGLVSKRLDVLFWGRNLADKTYLAYGYNFGAVSLGAPRTMGVTVTGRF